MGHNSQWVWFFCGLMGYDGEGEDGFARILLVWFGLVVGLGYPANGEWEVLLLGGCSGSWVCFNGFALMGWWIRKVFGFDGVLCFMGWLSLVQTELL